MDTKDLLEFAKSVKKNLKEMADIDCQFGTSAAQEEGFTSGGLAVIVGITGKMPGRIIIDASKTVAEDLALVINGDESIEWELVMDTMAELANIISGNAISWINNAKKGLSLSLTPPSVFCGDEMRIISPRLKAQIIPIKLPQGELRISVGFEEGG